MFSVANCKSQSRAQIILSDCVINKDTKTDFCGIFLPGFFWKNHERKFRTLRKTYATRKIRLRLVYKYLYSQN